MGARTHRDHRVQIVLELGGRGVLGDAREVRVRARPRGDAPAREREVVTSSLSRDCARRNKERVGDGGREGTGGRSARARVQDSSAWIIRSIASRASRRPARSRDARAPGPGQSRHSLSLASEEIFEEAAASVGKEAYPRRPRGAYRFGSRRPQSRQCSGARSTRGRIARPRAAARPREVRPRPTCKRHRARQTSRRLAFSCAARRRGAFRAGRCDAGERAGGCGRYRAVGNSRDGSVARVLLGERRRVRLCVGRRFLNSVVFCREKFVRASFSGRFLDVCAPRAAASWHLP
jgi:hypothetical protein